MATLPSWPGLGQPVEDPLAEWQGKTGDPLDPAAGTRDHRAKPRSGYATGDDADALVRKILRETQAVAFAQPAVTLREYARRYPGKPVAFVERIA